MKEFLWLFFLSLASLPRAEGAPQNYVVNPSFESANLLNPNLASSWQVYGGTYTRMSIPGAWDQSYVARMTSGAGAVERIVLNQTVPIPIRISVRVKGESIADDPADKLGASLDCKVMYQDGTSAWCPTTAKTKNVGTFDWKWVGYNTANLSSTNSPIAWIDVRLRMGTVTGTAWFDDVHVDEWIPKQNGLVSFVFDDSLLSTYTKAYPMMKPYGFVGTEAVTTSRVDVAGYMTLPNLKDLYANGWSVMGHTVSHPDLVTLGAVGIGDELYFSHKYLVDNGFPVNHLALPFGSYNGLVMTQAQKERYASFAYTSVRSSDRGFNPQGVFPYNIYVQEINSTTTAEDVSLWLTTARERKMWLVLLLHEVDNPNGVYTVTSVTLKKILDTVAISGLPVVTYDEGFKIVMLES